ncbi:AAA family ATPase [Mesorhizobium sp. M1380]|uniref:AAA family ATPase n=1 Tax=Mesorhizobium sp. M1380 TaxID=2957093 RepID=UPI0033394414
MAIDDLVLLRTTVENWVKVASEAVRGFKRDDGSFRKDSKPVLDNKANVAPHITTSARAFIALLYADRLRDTRKGKKLPEWHKDFTKLVKRATVGRQGRRFYEALKNRSTGEKVDPYEFNTFDIAHLADFFQVSAYLDRFYDASTDVKTFFKPKPAPESFQFDLDEEGEPPLEGCVRPEEYNDMDPRGMIVRRLREAISEASKPNNVGVGFPGEVRFEEGRAESRHYFATLHTLRALHALGVEDINGLAAVVAGARSFAIEQSYYFQRGATHRQDPVRLAFAGCIYAIYDEHVDKDLCLAIVEALAAGQQENGSWPATHPVFRKNSTPWHIASHEVALCLSWLYFQPRVPDAARPLIVSMMRKYLINGVIPTFVRGSSNADTSAPARSKLDGWQDDHTVSPDTTLGWATAIVCHFLAGFTQVLNDWINRRVIEELGLQLATKGYLIDDTASSPSARWARQDDRPYVWPDLPPHGWVKDKPDPNDEKSRIESSWTDPTVGARISQGLAEKVLAPIHGNPGEQPSPDRCSGLMPGSPGTRKTSLVKQVSEILHWPMVAVPASSIFEEGFDRMEARANRVFGLLNQLRGCVIFFDEFEEFFLSRGEDDAGVPGVVEETTSAYGRMTPGKDDVSQPDPAPRENEAKFATPHLSDTYKSRTIAAFTTSAMLPRLQELHDQDRCLIFLATNYPKKLDSAIKRAGRFDFTITVEHPTIERLQEYLVELNKNTLRSTDLERIDEKHVRKLLVAVRAVLKDHAEKTGAKSVKFAIVEEILRQVRPIEKKSGEDLEKTAAEILERQLRASEGGNPPELVAL